MKPAERAYERPPEKKEGEEEDQMEAGTSASGTATNEDDSMETGE